MIIEDDRIFIRDRHSHKIIVFSLQGEHLYSIDKKGRGPGEYLEIKNFTTDDENVYLLDNYTNKLRVYDKFNGEYKYEKTLPIVANDVAVFDNGDFMFTVSPYGGKFSLDQSSHRIFITDSDLNIKASMLPFDDGESDSIGAQKVLKSDNNYIYFHKEMDDEIYCFSHRDPFEHKVCMVDFGKNKVPDKFRNDYENALGYKFFVETPLFCDDYIYFEIMMGDYFDVFVYDMKNNEMLWNND